MNEMSMPGAFPEAVEERAAVLRTPKKKFIGRRAFEAKQRQGDGGSVEETTAMVQSGESTLKMESYSNRCQCREERLVR
jgi:hypothetical protein